MARSLEHLNSLCLRHEQRIAELVDQVQKVEEHLTTRDSNHTAEANGKLNSRDVSDRLPVSTVVAQSKGEGFNPLGRPRPHPPPQCDFHGTSWTIPTRTLFSRDVSERLVVVCSVERRTENAVRYLLSERRKCIAGTKNYGFY